MIRIVWAPAAAADLEAIHEYIATKSPDQARLVVARQWPIDPRQLQDPS